VRRPWCGAVPTFPARVFDAAADASLAEYFITPTELSPTTRVGVVAILRPHTCQLQPRFPFWPGLFVGGGVKRKDISTILNGLAAYQKEPQARVRARLGPRARAGTQYIARPRMAESIRGSAIPLRSQIKVTPRGPGRSLPELISVFNVVPSESPRALRIWRSSVKSASALPRAGAFHCGGQRGRLATHPLHIRPP
jgi:hypothetical protein